MHTVFLNRLNAPFLCRMCWEADRQPEPGALDYVVPSHGSGWTAGIATGIIGGVSMRAMPGSAQSELYEGLLPVEPSDEPPPLRPTVLENDPPLNGQPSLRKRASRTISRFLITFCLGIAATLAWQAYGDAFRETMVNSYPQLGWLAPQPKSADTLALPPTPSFDQQQLSAMSQDLEAVRQSIDRIATSIAAAQGQMTQNIDRIATGISSSQEQMMRGIDQLATGQERVALEITKLQAVEQYKNSEPLPRTDPPPAPKRIPWPSQASTAR
jgi:hypothetical protein